MGNHFAMRQVGAGAVKQGPFFEGQHGTDAVKNSKHKLFLALEVEKPCACTHSLQTFEMEFSTALIFSMNLTVRSMPHRMAPAFLPPSCFTSLFAHRL